MSDVLTFESGSEVVEFDPARWWSCSCGATTRRSIVAPGVCEHVSRFAARMPVDVLARMATAAKAAQS